jgi:hypothetical protein
MTPTEATELAGFLKAAFPALTDEQVSVYESGLLFEDAEHASRAILAGVREWKFPPRYAEIVERIRMERRASQPTVSEPPSPKISGIPLWVRRWIAARYLYASFGRELDMRRFPEQFGQPGDPEANGSMPDDEWLEESDHVSDDHVWKTILT